MSHCSTEVTLNTHARENPIHTVIDHSLFKCIRVLFIYQFLQFLILMFA